MKRFFVTSVSLLLLVCTLATVLVSCGEPEPEHIDYAASVTLDMSSDTLKEEVTVKAFIDGDTTHFYVPTSVSNSGVLKARYLAVNTPESTGKIEEWGKKASKFTKEKLSTAVSIIIESDNSTWNADSTGDRYLVWVWYKSDEASEYRNLNIELLQNGLAIASNSAQNRYGETCTKAIDQAKVEMLNINSGEKDPDFCYADAISVDLKELRCNIEEYEGQKVTFEGVVTKNGTSSVYVESYDAETDLYYGMYVYYGYSLSGDGLEILAVGNKVRIVGSVQYYENGDSYQVSDLQYRVMKPNDPNNIQKLDDEAYTPAYLPTDPATFKTGTVTLKDEEDNATTYSYAELALYTSVKMENLVVKSVYTTTNEESSSNGAMTLTCEVNGVEIAVRTAVLYDADGNLVTASYFNGKTIDVQGIVDYYKTDSTADFPYQIKVFSLDDITIKN